MLPVRGPTSYAQVLEVKYFRNYLDQNKKARHTYTFF